MIEKVTDKSILSYCLVFIIAFIPSFIFIQGTPIQLWDESRLAINAYEMHQNNNWLVTYFTDGVEMWNTKPPLLMWLQTICLKIFGVNIFSIRLPIALAGMATGLFMFTSLRKITGSRAFAVFSVLILFSSNGYVSNHILRTGDYDGLLVLFLTMAAIFYFQFLEQKSSKYLYFFAVSFSLALLTKGIAGLMLAPSLFIYTLYKKSLLSTLKNPNLYLAIILIFAPVISYYLLRESANPGFIKRMYINEIGGRYLNVIEEHNHPFYFYIRNLIKDRFLFWIPCFIIGIFLLFKNAKRPQFKIGIFSIFMIIPFFLIISSSKTKLTWYDAPVFPFLAIIAAIPLQYFYQYISKQQKGTLKITFSSLLILLIFISFSINIVIIGANAIKIKNERYNSIPKFILSELKHPTKNLDLTLVTYEYVPDAIFMIKAANEKNILLEYKNIDELNGDENIFSNSEKSIEELKQRFGYIDYFKKGNVYFIQLQKKQ
ncbi:MAG TPA: glycosyltransferase family 39 protein [Edaphocola sp.]|nr:glycosyltransferase family 39 protein [Edaphocola sp.]